MKKFMLVTLFTIPFCMAADLYQSWDRAVDIKYPDVDLNALFMWGEDIDLSNSQITSIPERLALPSATTLNLSGNKIQKIPERLTLYWLENLDLSNNQLMEITPEQIQQFPELRWLNVRGNKHITQKQIKALNTAFPNLLIEADNLGYLDMKEK